MIIVVLMSTLGKGWAQEEEYCLTDLLFGSSEYESSEDYDDSKVNFGTVLAGSGILAMGVASCLLLHGELNPYGNRIMLIGLVGGGALALLGKGVEATITVIQEKEKSNTHQLTLQSGHQFDIRIKERAREEISFYLLEEGHSQIHTVNKKYINSLKRLKVGGAI